MSLLSSPEDFDPRILMNEPLMFLHWYTDPDFQIFRQPRKVIPLSTRMQRTRNQVHLPLTNEQILSIRTHYYLEWQLLTITTLALVSAYFMFNPLLLFYIRYENDKSLKSQYASLLFVIFYGSCIVSIAFWMFISRLSIWHSTFNTYNNTIHNINNNYNNNNNNPNRQEVANDTDSDFSDSGDENEQQQHISGINQNSGNSAYTNNSNNNQYNTHPSQHNAHRIQQQQGGAVSAATSRVTGFIVTIRWCLFGYALSLGIFAAVDSYAQLIIAAAISGSFFPVLLVTSSNVVIYGMKRLPSVSNDTTAIFYIIVCGWIFVPLITAIIGEYIGYRWPFVVFSILILLSLGVTMFFHPGQPTISMIAEKESDLLDDAGNVTDSAQLTTKSLTGTHPTITSSEETNDMTGGRGVGYDDTTPLRAGIMSDDSYDIEDDTSSVVSDASSIFRLPGDREAPVLEIESDEKDAGRNMRGRSNDTRQKQLQRERARYENELKRAGIEIPKPGDNENENERPSCGCLNNPIMRNSCDYNFRLMSSSMGIFQISTFLLLIQSFSIDLIIGAYLTWYPIVMKDAFDQKFVLSGIQMSITGIVVVFFATWMARRNAKQFFLYSVNICASFFVILLSICMIEFGDILFYWFIFPLIIGCIILIGMISRMMLSRITPNGCLSFINGSTQIFHLAAFAVGPLILGIIDGFGEDDSDFYFFSLIYCLLAVHICASIGLYFTQLVFTAIKVWGLSTYQKRP